MDPMPSDMVLEQNDHPFILSSRVLKTPVFDRGGNRIGHVDDLSIEKTSGRVVHAMLSFGGFLGIGEKFHPVPWALLEYDAARGGFTVSVDPGAFKDAPAFTREELRGFGAADRHRYDDAVIDYYGPYGMRPLHPPVRPAASEIGNEVLR